MNFFEAIISVFSKYATFSGRARRSEYWYFYLFISVIQVIFSLLNKKFPFLLVPDLIFVMAIFLPALAVMVRRLHDTGKSGWYWLLKLIPLVGDILLLVQLCTEGEWRENKYGPNPKYGNRTHYGPNNEDTD